MIDLASRRQNRLILEIFRCIYGDEVADEIEAMVENMTNDDVAPTTITEIEIIPLKSLTDPAEMMRVLEIDENGNDTSPNGPTEADIPPEPIPEHITEGIHVMDECTCCKIHFTSNTLDPRDDPKVLEKVVKSVEAISKLDPTKSDYTDKQKKEMLKQIKKDIKKEIKNDVKRLKKDKKDKKDGRSPDPPSGRSEGVV